MASITHPEPRNHYRVSLDELQAYVQGLQTVALREKVPLADVIAAARVLEMKRRNDLYWDNGDNFDEQFSGLGDILGRLEESVAKISNKID